MAWCNAPGVQLALVVRALVRSAPARAVRMRQLALGLVALSLGACDFPTEPPIFESRFVFPAEATTLSINQLLPASVTVSGNEFNLSIPAEVSTRTLGQMCPACIPFHGLTVPKPAFADQFPLTIALPADVQSAVLAGGSVQLQLSHNFGFDVLRPAGAAQDGNIVVTVRSGGVTIGMKTIDAAFPSGSVLTELVPMMAGATVTSPLTVDIALTSPAGGAANPVLMNAGAQLNVVAAPAGVRVSSAVVAVPAGDVSVEQVTLDLEGIDDFIADRVERGAIVLRMTNPFNVSGTLNLTITGAGTNITKPVAVAACAAATPCLTTQRIEFTGAELQSMLGNILTMRIAGRLTSGFFTVRPNQSIGIDTDLDLTLRFGSTD